MRRAPQASIDGIIQVAERLGSLRDQVVFLGGAVTGLLLTDPAASEARITEDVDIIVSAVTRSTYYDWERVLQSLGFERRRWEGDPLCRWTIDGIIVDIMPIEEDVLGFNNRWYRPAMETAATITLTKDLPIRVVSAPYFVATKVDAFHNRGGGDYLSSRDIQDIVAVVDGRPELVEEVRVAEESLRSFLVAAFQNFLANSDFLESLPAHLLPDTASQQRAPIIEGRCKRLADLSH